MDLNDEAMNMMQFQKAMNAAMRLMTVVDEALDRLIINTVLNWLMQKITPRKKIIE